MGWTSSNYSTHLCSMCTDTLTHFEMMPGADAEFEDQYSVILSALFDIHRHTPSKPSSWIWEKLLQAFEASIWGLGEFLLLIWAI